MSSISDIIKIPFGYMLEWLYNFTSNYGLALILFAVIIKLVLLPVSMKSKKSMMKMSRIAPRVKALEAKFGDDKAKYQTEVMKLYKREGVSTTGGCLWSFIPLLILIPLYAIIREPMVYMMHLSAEHATQITELISKTVDLGSNTYYHQMAAASHLGEFLPQIREAIPALANATINPINFGFLGLDMGLVPSWRFWQMTSMTSIGLFLIPVVSGASNWLSMWLMQKLNGSVAVDSKGRKDENAAAAAMGGSMKVMNIMMPLMSVWIGFQMPAGMSIYWITQAVVGLVQEFFLTRHYRKIYDAEDEVRRREAEEEEAREAERERLRAERKALHPEGQLDPNTSKKKLQVKEKAATGPEIEGKLSPEEREALRLARENAENEPGKNFSGDPDRPYCRGRTYKPTRYGRDTSEANNFDLSTSDSEAEDSADDEQAASEE